MVRHASLFGQLVALFNRQWFHELVYRHRSERYAKGYLSWEHFVAMLFCQMVQAKSLREISGGLVRLFHDADYNTAKRVAVGR
jgi:Domain of unknown function (DUF4372)